MRWNGKSVPLVPVCKGKTTIEGTHPLKKIKKAPLNIDNVENIMNNRKIRETAMKIAEILNLEGCADIDMIFDPETGQNNVIENQHQTQRHEIHYSSGYRRQYFARTD